MQDLIVNIYRMIVPWGNMNKRINRIYRKMSRAQKKGNRFLSNYYCYKLEKKYQCRISPEAVIGKALQIAHPNGVVIGDGARIGNNVTIFQQVTIGQNLGKYPTIGNNVIIYAGAKIVGGITIGDNCIIGANAVVVKDAPEGAILGGVPAKVIKKRSNTELYK